jgi:hypothetical protein
LHQAYILVNKAGFSYLDVKSMPLSDRLCFIKFIKDDAEKLKEGIS